MKSSDIFDSLFGKDGFDGWTKNIQKKAEEEQIEIEINQEVEKNPEFIHKMGVINSIKQQLKDKFKELNAMETEIRVDIANRIIAASGDRYKGYMFKVPAKSASIFGETSGPSIKKKEEEE